MLTDVDLYLLSYGPLFSNLFFEIIFTSRSAAERVKLKFSLYCLFTIFFN